MKVSSATYLSMFFNSFLPGAKPCEMLSSHTHRSNNKTAIAILDRIFGKGHCEKCYDWEQKFLSELQYDS